LEGSDNRCKDQELFVDSVKLFVFPCRCPSTDVARHKSGELPLAPPSETYSATLIKGLVEGKQLDTKEAANYINDAAVRGL
jgi:histone deacetylase 6